MNFPLLIPKENSVKQSRDGRNPDFWDKFWVQFEGAEEYTKHIGLVKSSIKKVSDIGVSDEERVYADIKLAPSATSKSTKPLGLLADANIDVLAAPDKLTYTISAKKKDYKKLVDFLEGADFDKAKQVTHGITKKTKNLYRQAYAIAGVEIDRNTNLKKRLSDELYNRLANANDGQIIDCIIEIYQDVTRPDYDKLFIKLREKLGIDKVFTRNPKLFVTNASYRAYLGVNDFHELLENVSFRFISKIKQTPILMGQRCIPSVDLSNVSVLNPITNEIVGVFDSGIDNSLLKRLIFQKINTISGKKENKSHGTFVASRVIFGNSIFKAAQTGEIEPAARILDIQVLFDDNKGNVVPDIDDLSNTIDEILKRYSKDIVIYNFSISENKAVTNNDIDELTEYIDKKCREYDVLFVCAAGNHTYFESYDYPDLFNHASISVNVASPGDALNVLSVGAIAKIADADAICKTVGHPSPFTRKGGFRKGWKKPELVADGGNVKLDTTQDYTDTFKLASNNVYGVEGVTDQGLHKNIGTSFGVPLITRQCILLWDYIKKTNIPKRFDLTNNRSNLIKALLIHSTAKVEQVDTKKLPHKHALGFGEPSYLNALQDDPNSFSFVYCDTLQFKSKKQKIDILLPKRFIGRGVQFLLTLVYNPPVDKHFPENYNMISLNASIRTIVPTKITATNKSGHEAVSANPSSWDWERYKQSNYNTIHFRSNKKVIRSPHVEVLVQMDVFEEYEKLNLGNEESISQPYAIVLTVIDNENNGTLRDEIMEEGQFEEIIENVIDVPVVDAEVS